ncbi:drug/metabolite transporter (DMT)-like permease [Bacilli bacterium PM5-3]|nr:drug/metabolite transporter (DMT)-like permease [Bacilli bacterium PM5-3]MDH6604033.1 drug/metabolite transporter (DMT)-like permease [Bacilli bacterium PM5-9]
MKTWQANICLVIVAMIWGAGFVATEQALKFLEPLQMQIFRFGIAALIVTVVFFKRLKNASKQSIIYGSIIGLVFFIAMTFQTFGLTDTTVPKNAFITVTNVVWVPLISFIIFKIKPKAYLLYGIIVMLVGFFFLIFEVDIFNLSSSLASLSSQMNVTFGDFLTLICAIAFAAHIILGGRFVKDEDPITILIFQLYVSTILSIVLSCFMEGSPLNIEPSNLVSALPSLTFMAVFSSVISFALQLIAQQYVPAANTAVICSTESLFASIFAVLLGSVPLTSSLVISSFVITIGIIWAETGFKFKEEG